MPLNFDTEIRSTFGKEYIKVFLSNMGDSDNVSALLESLNCVRRVNISNEGKDLTVYPTKLYTAKEACSEIRNSLNSYYGDNSSSKIVNSLNHTKEILTGHDKSKKLYDDAVKNISTNGSNRETLDSIRLALEKYLQEVLGNNKPLEHQENPLKDYLKARNVTHEVQVNLTTSLHNFYKYQDNNVKHDDNIKDEEVGYFIGIANGIVEQLNKY